MPKLIEIRSWLAEHQSGQKAVTLGGHTLPSNVGATVSSPWRVLCLAPAEWLLITEDTAPMPDEPGLVLTEATDGIAVVSVGGPRARDILSKGCGLDVDAQMFSVGRCARTRLAQLQVVVDCVDAAPRFDLYVSRSSLRFLSDWLEDAAVEFSDGSP